MKFLPNFATFVRIMIIYYFTDRTIKNCVKFYDEDQKKILRISLEFFNFCPKIMVFFQKKSRHFESVSDFSIFVSKSWCFLVLPSVYWIQKFRALESFLEFFPDTAPKSEHVRNFLDGMATLS